MNLTSNPVQEIFGDVKCPGDKSISQRILIIGSLLNCDINVSGFLNAKDPLSTMAALNQIGALINKDGDLVKIKKRSKPFISPESSIDLGNSGTGIRLLTGLISGLNLKATLVGDESLSQRPMSRVIDPLVKMGKKILSNDGKTPINIIGGSINDNFKYQMPVASAQVKSSLILASLSSGNSIQIKEPKATRDHTEKMIEHCGGKIDVQKSSEGKIISLYKSNLSEIS